MAIYTSNRDGGKTDQAGHLRAATKMWVGEIIENLQVTANSPLGMSVLVTTGMGLIPSGSGYSFPFWTDANEVVTITTASGANDRIDLVVAYVDLDETPSTGVSNNSNDIIKIEAVAGTPGAVPVAPDSTAIQSAIGAANPYIILGQVLVAQSITTINTSAITDRRTKANNREAAGTLKEFAGANLPAGYLWCAGQAVSRTTYADLFKSISTTWGVGDGSTTFNVPDLRGRTTAGKDNMNGTSANRLTAPLDGDVLGAVGGGQAHTHDLSSSAYAKINNAAGKAARMLRVATSAWTSNASATGGEGGDAYNSTGGAGLGGATDDGSALQPTAIVNKIIAY